MIKWFKNCNNIEAVKKMYRKLCMQYHPDLHATESDKEKYETAMKEINAEYDIMFERYKNVHAAHGDESSTKANTSNGNAESDTSYYSTDETPEMFRDIINGLIHCDGVQIDIVGSWVWLTGNTFAHKDTIKGLGFKWASKKKAWYWHSGEYSSRHSKMTLDEIKNKYGCQSVKTSKQLRIS